jgi:hypothetical protein
MGEADGLGGVLEGEAVTAALKRNLLFHFWD